MPVLSSSPRTFAQILQSSVRWWPDNEAVVTPQARLTY
jgi:hypothetical protein